MSSIENRIQNIRKSIMKHAVSMKEKAKKQGFEFKPFSVKQKKVLTWWCESSPVKSKEGIIADGAIRSGKTLCMSLSYVLWAMSTFNQQNFGTEITLDRVDEWKDIEPEVYVHGLEYPLFVYWRNPYANAIDKESPLTVPAFSECIEELRWLDIALSKMGDEQEDSQHMTFVSQSAIQFANAQGIELPRFVSGLEQGINEDNTIHEHVPTLLVTDRVSAINFYLSIIGYKCGFSNGYFSFDQNQGIQTATQVESDDRRTLHTIQAFRNILDGKNHDGVLHRIEK